MVSGSPGQQLLPSVTLFILHKAKALELLFVRSASYTPSTVRTQPAALWLLLLWLHQHLHPGKQQPDKRCSVSVAHAAIEANSWGPEVKMKVTREEVAGILAWIFRILYPALWLLEEGPP